MCFLIKYQIEIACCESNIKELFFFFEFKIRPEVDRFMVSCLAIKKKKAHFRLKITCVFPISLDVYIKIIIIIIDFC